MRPDKALRLCVHDHRGHRLLPVPARVHASHLPADLSASRQTRRTAHYAIEFWNTLCDVEEEITEEQEIFEEATRNGDNPSQPQRSLANYVRGAVKHLIPVIFEAMCKQNEYDDELSIAIQASCCMQLCARAVGDSILEFTMPIISGNIRQQDWHKREAATYAFGAIMEGCSEQAISQITVQSLPVLVEMVKSEQHGKTKETAAWTLSRVTEFQFNVIPAAALDQVITAALTGLGDASGGVCHQCCSIPSVLPSPKTTRVTCSDKLSPNTSTQSCSNSLLHLGVGSLGAQPSTCVARGHQYLD